MLLYFMRHGDAEAGRPGQADAERKLTSEGLQRTQQEAAGLVALGVTLDLVLTSPAVRAAQTAEIVARTLFAELQPEKLLAGRVTVDTLQEISERHDIGSSLMLVGHEPDFSTVIGELIGGASVEMKKGAVACLTVQGLARGGAVLHWLLTGKQLAMIG